MGLIFRRGLSTITTPPGAAVRGLRSMIVVGILKNKKARSKRADGSDDESTDDQSRSDPTLPYA